MEPAHACVAHQCAQCGDDVPCPQGQTCNPHGVCVDSCIATRGAWPPHARLANRVVTFELRRRTGYVIQDAGLFPHVTVADNIATVPRLLGWQADRVTARVDELLALVGLDPAVFRSRWPDELSGGQRQRAGLARALAADPPLLLMDEPFGALDPITKAELHAEFVRLQRTLHRSVILVTHDMAEACTLADQIAVLHEGELIACDTPAIVRAMPDPRIRALMGDVRFATEAEATVVKPAAAT